MVIGLFLLLFAILIFLSYMGGAFPIKGLGLARCEVNKSYTENVPYLATEYYITRVPLTTLQNAPGEPDAQGTYTEEECLSVPYTEYECTQQAVAYSVTNKTCYRTGWLQNWSNVECTLNNIDSVGGYFTVYTGFGTGLDNYEWIPSGTWVRLTDTGVSRTVYLYPKASKTFDYHMEVESPDTPFICHCYATSLSTKEVCGNVQETRQECHKVLKYRTLADQNASNAAKNSGAVSYRNETRSRTVVKYRAETRYKIVEEAC